MVKDNISSRQSRQKAQGCHIYIRHMGFKIRKVLRDREGHFLMIKGHVHQEEFTFINIYVT